MAGTCCAARNKLSLDFLFPLAGTGMKCRPCEFAKPKTNHNDSLYDIGWRPISPAFPKIPVKSASGF
jgi:hypothetical protein